MDIKKAGIDYHAFMRSFTDQVQNANLNDESELKHYENRKLNLHRVQKWNKIFVPSQKLIDIVSSISSTQTWMFVTESWCGDSAQSLPIIAKAAALNDKINLQIVLRDENLEIMDRYLTNGSRSIPKLVVFDSDNNELFQWGPRPALAKNLFTKLKNDGAEKAEINREIHLWYAKDRGKEIDNELTNLLRCGTSFL